MKQNSFQTTLFNNMAFVYRDTKQVENKDF